MAIGDFRSKVGVRLALRGLLLLLSGHAVGQVVEPVAATAHDAMRVAALVAAAPCSVSPAEPVATESGLRLAAQQALWPADIVRLSADYLRLYPQHPWAADADRIHQRARWTADLLQQADVQLYRPAFDARGLSAEHTDELRLAALGDPAASWRIAQRLPVRDGRWWRHVGWLQYAASLGSDEAAYALALHYRRDGQALLAARYEARAIALGFELPPALDHRRR
jgi:hypothetical protein